MSLLLPQSELDKLMLADFVAVRTRGRSVQWHNYYSMGWESGGRIAAGVVFCNFDGSGADIHIAGAEGYNYPPKQLIFAVFDYAFRVAALRRLTAKVARSNERMLKWTNRIGFCREGICRRGSPTGEDQVIFGMLKEECKWLSDERLVSSLKRSA